MAGIRKAKKQQLTRELPIDLFLTHTKEVEAILSAAVLEALRFHKRIGNPVATMKGRKIVLLQPNEIPVDVDQPRNLAKSVTVE